MSSKGTSAMSEETDKKSALVPRLRFPEFDGILSALPLAAVADFVSEKIRVDEITSEQYVSTENLLPDFGGMNPAVKLPSVSSVTSFRPNDILVSNIRPYLRKVWQANICGGASNDVLVVRPTERIGADYLAAILRSDLFIDYVMRGAKGVKMPRGEFSMIQEFPVPCPSADEQQKIADCLSSLDELITAETHALTALKTHKKGLMQQLFPREGETVPRLRFPEFREAGEWEEDVLGNLVEIRSGNSPSQYELGEGGAYPFVKVEDLNNCAKLQTTAREYSDDSDGLIPLDSVIFPKRGAAIALNKIRLSGQELLMDTNMMALTPHGECRADFLFHYLSQVGLSKIADNSTIPQINNKHIIPFHIQLPLPKEQERVADCLSFLDDLIAAQTQKIDALKTHKKGLIQQLFPVLDEVPA